MLHRSLSLALVGEDVDRLRRDYTQKELNGRIKELTFRFERNPEDGDAINSIGVVQHRLGRPEDALATFRKPSKSRRISTMLGSTSGLFSSTVTRRKP